MKTQIFYFSGTGNSLYIARELQKEIPESYLVPIISASKLNNIESDGDNVGIVFPIHAFTVPIPVKNFLKRVNLDSASYVFAIATRGGSPCNIFSDINKILKEKNKSLDSHFFIDMPNNFTHIAETPTQNDIERLNNEALKKLDLIKNIIVNGDKYKDKDLNKSLLKEKVLFPALSALLRKTNYLNMDRNFYADSSCSGCGLCSKVCAVKKIEIKNSKPQWKNDIKCMFCFACFNYCPTKAIQIRKTKSCNKGRYHHLEVTAADIAMQK